MISWEIGLEFNAEKSIEPNELFLYERGEKSHVCLIFDTCLELVLMCPAIDNARKSGGLPLIRALVAELEYELALHAQDGVENNDFDPEDLEASISNGEVQKTEADELSNSLGNKKYTIVGRSACGRLLYSVGKIVCYPEGLTYRFISIKCHEVNYE